MIYLASPYSATEEQIDKEIAELELSKDSRYWIEMSIKQERYEMACLCVGDLMRNGQIAFSPIAHTHGIAVHGSLPGDWKFWERFDREFIENSEKVIVLRLDGWEKSKGVAAEIKIAEELGIPVEYMDP